MRIAVAAIFFGLVLSLSGLFALNRLKTRSVPTLPLKKQPELVLVNSLKQTDYKRPFSPEVTKTTNISQYPETNNWKLYHWSGNDYTFRYPSDWHLYTHEPTSSKCWNCREELLLTKSATYPSDGWGEILIYAQYTGTTGNQRDYEVAQLGYSAGQQISHEKINGIIATTYTEKKEDLQNRSTPLTIKNYMFYLNGLAYHFSLNDTAMTRESLTQNEQIFQKVLSTVKFTDPLVDWKSSQVANLATFNFPPNWQEIKSVPLEKMFTRQCTGPILQDQDNPDTIIAFEVVPKDYPGEFCWSKGDFSYKHAADMSDPNYSFLGNGVYKRSILTLLTHQQIEVILWRPTENDSWHGDLFQNIAFETPDQKSKVVVALISQSKNEKATNLVYDLILGTIHFR